MDAFFVLFLFVFTADTSLLYSFVVFVCVGLGGLESDGGGIGKIISINS